MSASSHTLGEPAELPRARNDRAIGPVLRQRIDTMLVGGMAVVLWCFVVVADAAGLALPVHGWLFWTAAFIGATHFAMSYRLAYHDRGAAIRRHPIALLGAPTALGIALLIGVAWARSGSEQATALIKVGLTAVYALTIWHYVKQVYGVVRLAGRFTGFGFGRREALVIRYGLYPLWFVSLLSFASGRTLVDVDGFEVRADLLPLSSDLLRPALVIATATCLGVVLATAGWRQRRRPPSMIVMPCLAAVLWVGLTPNLLIAVVLLPAMHALQYLALCHRTMGGLLEQSGDPARSSTTFDVAQILVGAGSVGLLATSFLPDALSSIAGVPNEPGIWLLAIFVFLNLHHYLIDATIWRSDGQLVGILTGRGPQKTR